MCRARMVFVCLMALVVVDSLVLAPAQASILVVADYTFNDNALPAGFSVVAGTPTYSGGSMNLDGLSAIESATPLTATDNFGMEAIVTVSTFDSFNFPLANNDGFNKGFGLVSVGTTWQGILEAVTTFGSAAAATGTEVRLALVRAGGTSTLYVNGVDSGSTTGTPNVGTGLTTLTIGANRATGGGLEGLFKGSINEVRLFTFAEGGFNASTDLLGVPEPSTIALLVTGLIGLLCYAWRKRR